MSESSRKKLRKELLVAKLTLQWSRCSNFCCWGNDHAIDGSVMYGLRCSETPIKSVPVAGTRNSSSGSNFPDPSNKTNDCDGMPTFGFVLIKPA